MNEVIVKIIIKWANRICRDVYREWNNSNTEGKAKIDFAIIEYTVGKIIGQFTASGSKAWICEYGKGSLMNPADLAHYKQTKYWNDYRNGTAISGREQGIYYDLDDDTHYSSGINRGRDLEVTKIAKFQPIAAKDTIHKLVSNQNSAVWKLMIAEINAEIRNYIVTVVLPKGKFTLKG